MGSERDSVKYTIIERGGDVDLKKPQNPASNLKSYLGLTCSGGGREENGIVWYLHIAKGSGRQWGEMQPQVILKVIEFTVSHLH